MMPTIYRLARLSPAHPSWHLCPVPGTGSTLCGRLLSAEAVVEPWQGTVPAKACTRCAPHMAHLREHGYLAGRRPA